MGHSAKPSAGVLCEQWTAERGWGLSRRPLKPDQFIVDLSVGALPGGLYRVALVDRSGLRGGASLSVVR